MKCGQFTDSCRLEQKIDCTWWRSFRRPTPNFVSLEGNFVLIDPSAYVQLYYSSHFQEVFSIPYSSIDYYLTVDPVPTFVK
jgi:hypothetical protein